MPDDGKKNGQIEKPASVAASVKDEPEDHSHNDPGEGNFPTVLHFFVIFENVRREAEDENQKRHQPQPHWPVLASLRFRTFDPAILLPWRCSRSNLAIVSVARANGRLSAGHDAVQKIADRARDSRRCGLFLFLLGRVVIAVV